MAGVLTDHVPQQDVLIRRGVDTRWGVRWQQASAPGGPLSPVNTSGWSGVCELRAPAPDGALWLSIPVLGETNGVTVVTVTAGMVAAAVWDGRPSGQWLINLTSPDGERVRLGDGLFFLEALR